MPHLIKQKDNLGFTLVEILVALAIFVVALGLIYNMFFSGWEAYQIGSAQADLQAKARVILSRMASELKNATNSYAVSPPDIAILPLPNNDSITFYIPEDVDADGLLTDAVNHDIEWNPANPIIYTHNAAQNTITRNGAIIAGNVASVGFFDINLDPALAINEIKIDLTLNRVTARRKNISVSLSERVTLRN